MKVPSNFSSPSDSTSTGPFANLPPLDQPPKSNPEDRISNRDRVRSLREQRHIAVAILAAVGTIFAFSFIDNLVGLLVFAYLVYVVLDSLAKALDANRGYLWGWVYSEPRRTTLSDEVADRVITRLGEARPDQADPRIRPI